MLSAEGEAPELRLHVDEVGLDAEGAGAAGDLLRRDAGQHEGVPDHGHSSRRARASSTTRTRRRRTSDSIKFWKTPVADCGNGKQGLHGLHEVAAGLDGDQGLVAAALAHGGGPLARGRPAAALSAAFWRRPWLRAAALLAPPLGWFVADLPRGARRRCSSRRSGAWTPSPARSSTPGTSTTSSTIVQRLDVPHDRAADDRDRGRGDRDRRAARVPVRVLHGAASRRRGARTLLFVLVLLPLWSSYLVRVYAWRLILATTASLNWSLGEARAARRRTSRYSNWAMWIVFSLHLAAVHDPAGLRGARADPGLVRRGLARPRRAAAGRRSGA